MCDDPIFEDPNDMEDNDSEGWTEVILTPSEDCQHEDEWCSKQDEVDPVTYWHLMNSDVGIPKIMEEELRKLFDKLDKAVLDNDDEKIKEIHQLISQTQQGIYPTDEGE